MGCASSVPAPASATTKPSRHEPAAAPPSGVSNSPPGREPTASSNNSNGGREATQTAPPSSQTVSTPAREEPTPPPSAPTPEVATTPPAPTTPPSDTPPAPAPSEPSPSVPDKPQPKKVDSTVEPETSHSAALTKEEPQPKPPAPEAAPPPTSDAPVPEVSTPALALRTALASDAAASLIVTLNPLPQPPTPANATCAGTVNSIIQWILGRSHEGKRMAWLSGAPGGGVHSTCLQLAKLAEEPSCGFTLLRHHVGSATGGAYTDPVYALRSLGFQLASAFGEQLAEHYLALRATTVSSFGHPRNALDALLTKPLAKVCGPSAAPIIILLEGLDPPPSRSNHDPLDTSLLLLARQVLVSTPQRAMLLLATSESPERSDELSYRLSDLAPFHLEAAPEEADALTKVLGAGEGGGAGGVEGPVSAYLANCGASPSELTPLLLPVLVSAREPLPLALLTACGASLDTHMTHISALFPVTDGFVAPANPSVVRFLCADSAGDWRVDVAAGHSALATTALAEISNLKAKEGGELTAKARYCLRNGVHHCLSSGEVSSPDSMVGDVSFWQRCFEAREGTAALDILRATVCGTLTSSSAPAKSAARLLASHSKELVGNNELTALRAFDSPPHSYFATALAAAPPDGQLLSRPAQWPRRVRSLEGHSRLVNAVAASADGRLVASGSDDCTVRLWDVAVGVEVATLKGHTDEVTSLAFSADNVIVASGSWDGDVLLWDAVSGARRTALKGHRSGVTAVAFLPGGAQLLSASDDKTVRVWDSVSGECTATMSAHAMTVTAVAVSADGAFYATGSEDTTVCVWDAASREERHCLERHASAIHALAISPDGKLLASGGWDKLICLWDLSSGELLLELPHSSAITGVAFSADGTRVLASAGKAVWVRDVVSGEVLDTLGGGDRHGEITCLALPDKAEHLITGSRDTTLSVWALTDPSSPTDGVDMMHTDVITAVAPTPDGHTVASSSWDKSVILWGVDSTANAAVRLETGHGSGVTALAVSADGKHLITGSDDRTVKVWALGGSAGPEEVPSLLPDSLLPEGILGVTALACSPVTGEGGLLFASGGKDMLVRMWRLVEGEEGGELSMTTVVAEHGRMVTSVAVSHHGALVASSSKDGKVFICNAVAVAESTRQSISLPYGVMQVAFSPDATLLAAACEDGTVSLCEVTTGAVQRQLSGHAGSVNSVAFSPSGSLIATGGKDGTVALWAASSGDRLKVCTGHKRAVTSVAFTFDGSSVVSGSEDRDVRLWQSVDPACGPW